MEMKILPDATHLDNDQLLWGGRFLKLNYFGVKKGVNATVKYDLSHLSEFLLYFFKMDFLHNIFKL